MARLPPPLVISGILLPCRRLADTYTGHRVSMLAFELILHPHLDPDRRLLH